MPLATSPTRPTHPNASSVPSGVVRRVAGARSRTLARAPGGITRMFPEAGAATPPGTLRAVDHSAAETRKRLEVELWP
jgi:hypothetical protein